MVIDSNNGINSSSGSLRSRGDARIEAGNNNAKSAADSAPAKPAGGEVSLSSEARNLSRLENQINAAPDVDSERVAQIKKAIAEGSFDINPESIAERMLEQDDLLN